MIIHTLGTSAGTGPVAGFHHTSIAIETGDSLYLFDAGECCSYTAHLLGIDLLKTKAVFISHTHMDHIGGLGNLLWNIRKINIGAEKKLPDDKVIRIYSPVTEAVDAVFGLLKFTEGNFSCNYSHAVLEVHEGTVYQDDNIRVDAVHTNHLPLYGGKYQSFCYHIFCEGKTVVFTGDMCIEDFNHILPEKCDVLMPETGHHRIENVLSAIDATNKEVDRIIFVHNAGYIMKNFDAEYAALKKSRPSAVISRDGDSFIV